MTPSKLSLLLYGLLIFTTFSCQNPEIDDLDLSNKSIMENKFVYNKKEYRIKYYIENDEIKFVDSHSESNYTYLKNEFDSIPDLSFHVSLSTHKNYLYKRNEDIIGVVYGKKSSNFPNRKLRLPGELTENDYYKNAVNNRESIDSSYLKISPTDEGQFILRYELNDILGLDSVGISPADNEILSKNGRKAWQPIGASIKLYRDINFDGTQYEVINPTKDYNEYQFYQVALSQFNDQTSSFKITNPTTRTMFVTFYEDWDGGRELSYDLPPRTSSYIPRITGSNLKDVKLKAGCFLFCKNWNDRISSVGVSWATGTAYTSAPAFASVVHEDIVIDYPIEYEWESTNILGYSLLKTSGGTGWNSGSASKYAVPSDGGYVEFEIDSKTTDFMMGLSTYNNAKLAQWNTIEYNLYVSKYRGNVIQIWKSGTLVKQWPYDYAVGDVVTIVNETNYVAFYANNAYVGRLAKTSQDNLYIDNSIYNYLAKIRKINYRY